MELIQAIINDLAKGMIAIDEERLRIAVRLSEAKGIVDAQELRQLEEAGIPVVIFISNVLHITIREANDKILNKEITYNDLICVLSMFSQSLRTISKHPLITTAGCKHFSVGYLKAEILDTDKPLDRDIQKVIDNHRKNMGNIVKPQINDPLSGT